MITIPSNAKKITPIHATVDFYEFMYDNHKYIAFDSSLSGAPEPMMNAMIGLKMLEYSNQRLLMINHSIPNGLFPKIKENFDYEVSELNDGNFEIIFEYKKGTPLVTNFEDSHCSG